ncbi:aminotransferase class V-fold PLP-dependent enzyme [Persicimonas caeni]|uniref:cysteine desulfurase n=1 Tax=Persicimonas caeni TaxID=2292766 RepID=A0A4Y6PQ98_PERCE|nr:cysteine desulfurase family protein [Persicimonas caeni]QDG50512.1 aminotransferase class V-fold PLP-dependent enzyme [Persicimonas caeni]QED31733.1 aminotransferase class V-fold PLP-dependent enzyme [Persicimonas caeni]
MADYSKLGDVEAIYLDCNASTPIDPRVGEAMYEMLHRNPANPAAKVHVYGQKASRAVEAAREQVALLVEARPEEVVFTSGASESDNLALLGWAERAHQQGTTHIVSSAIEHAAVLEPLRHLRDRGFEVDLIAPGPDGVVAAQDILDAVRPDTGLVSLMHVNNVIGTIQPIAQVAEGLADHPALFHVDGAQGAAHHFDELADPRIDLISLSAHKMYGPPGVGALVCRRGPKGPPIAPRSFGGEQEYGLRPGTVPAPLVVGFGEAAKLCRREVSERLEKNHTFRQSLLEGLAPLSPIFHGDLDRQVLHAVCLSIPGVRQKAALLRLRDLIAASTGSACSAVSDRPNHVLSAMGVPHSHIEESLRISWCHTTPAVDWSQVVARLAPLAE